MGSLPPSEGPPEPTAAECQVADLLPIEADPEIARAVLDRVPLWFHTFSLDGSKELYTHGIARDHRYRIPALPHDFDGMSVLDVGTFDGFYAFLAEARGARRVVAVDNEQYREWVSSRWGIELEGGEGFTAIRELLDSEVDYRRLDAFDLDELGETFDSMHEAKKQLFDYIEVFYNRSRRHSSIDYRSPARYETEQRLAA